MARHEIIRADGMAVHVTRGGDRQLFFAADNTEARLAPEQAARAAYQCISSIVSQYNMELTHERVFGSLGVMEAAEKARVQVLRQAGLPARPCSFIQGQPVFGDGLAGVLAHAVRPDEGTRLEEFNGASGAHGRAWLFGGVQYSQLLEVHGGGGDAPQVQAETMFSEAEAMLRARGGAYSDVVRTWLYLSRVLEWYADLNRARDTKYKEFGLMPALDAPEGAARILLPASTGIEGSNRHGSLCLMDALALSGGGRGGVRQMANKKQKDAFRYGSSFSRGACIHEPGAVRIEVSGTASIDETGKTVHVDNSSAQIECTLNAIDALLATENASLGDVAFATVFLKHPGDYALFRRIAEQRSLKTLPAVYVHADVCRDDLLFEMDGTAVLECVE